MTVEPQKKTKKKNCNNLRCTSGIPADTWTLQRLTFIIHHDRLRNIGTVLGHFVLMHSCQSGPSNPGLMTLQPACCNQPENATVVVLLDWITPQSLFTGWRARVIFIM